MKKYSLDFIKETAKNKNGECLIDNYIDNKQQLVWKCNICNFIWKTCFSNIIKGTWCPNCKIQSKKYSKEFIDNFSNERNIKLISDYTNCLDNLFWQCNICNNIWKSTLNRLVYKNSTCPQCSSGLYERICKIYFEQLFNNKFPKIKPSWLRNDKNNIMELDGYCEELKLAFEHNGEQHYSNNWKYQIDLEQRKLDDLKKIELCKQHNVTLVVIPELISITKISQLKKLIKNELSKVNYNIPENYDSINIDLSFAYSKNNDKIDELKNYAINNNGEFLSEYYVGSHEKYKWKCNACKQIWEASINSVISRKSWCPNCNGSKKGTIEEMNILAKNKNGECLSDVYYSRHIKLLWKCNVCNTKWEAKPGTIMHRHTWCPSCAKAKKLKSNFVTMP